MRDPEISFTEKFSFKKETNPDQPNTNCMKKNKLEQTIDQHLQDEQLIVPGLVPGIGAAKSHKNNNTALKAC